MVDSLLLVWLVCLECFPTSGNLFNFLLSFISCCWDRLNGAPPFIIYSAFYKPISIRVVIRAIDHLPSRNVSTMIQQSQFCRKFTGFSELSTPVICVAGVCSAHSGHLLMPNADMVGIQPPCLYWRFTNVAVGYSSYLLACPLLKDTAYV